MPLRFITLALLLINLMYFAWARGWVDALTGQDAAQREPQRSAQQINPESIGLQALRLDSEASKATSHSDKPNAIDSESASATNAASVSVCYRARITTDDQEKQWRDYLKSQSVASPVQVTLTVTGGERWLVYMGPYPDAPTLERKQAELRRMNLSIQSVEKPSLKNGIALGAYAHEVDARQAWEQFKRKGVRTATIVLEKNEAVQKWLMVHARDEGIWLDWVRNRPQLKTPNAIMCL